MLKLSLLVAVVLCLATAARAETVTELVAGQVGCPAEENLDECLQAKISDFLQKAIAALSGLLGSSDSTGFTLQPIKFEFGSIEGKGIKIIGLDTASVEGVSLKDDTLSGIVNIKSLEAEGDFVLELNLIGKHDAHIEAKLKGLKAKIAIKLGVKDGKLVVEDVDIKMKVKNFAVKINNGGPLVTKKMPLKKVINSMVRSLVKRLNNKKTLNRAIIPMVTGYLENLIKKNLNELLQRPTAPTSTPFTA